MDDEYDFSGCSTEELLEILRSRRGPQVLENALYEISQRGHPDVAVIAHRIPLETSDEWLRASAVTTLLAADHAAGVELALSMIDTCSPWVLRDIVDVLATTDDPRLMGERELIRRVRRRLDDLPPGEEFSKALFRKHHPG